MSYRSMVMRQFSFIKEQAVSIAEEFALLLTELNLAHISDIIMDRLS